MARLARTARGYHWGMVEGVEPGTPYVYCLDGKKNRPDPASAFQPAGVHAASQVVDGQNFRWSDAGWRGIPLEDYIIYEVHVGTYSPEGTFDAVVPHLDEIKNLGMTALELMPIAQFPGSRNWGYDGVYPFAVQNSYGGPDGLKKLVDACHARGLAVVLDVVYNHLGPEGNYLADFGPYFTDQYQSLWGQAINFDGPESDEVVRYFTENALYWLRDFHIDALRLDAIHGIVDSSAQPFLKLLAKSVHDFAQQSGRMIYLIAESDLNDARYIQPVEQGGLGLDAQWSDDLHHALHTLLTGEQTGYYQDFGKVEHLEKALSEGFVYSGQYSAYRRHRHGNSSRGLPPSRFVVFCQNHDQVGNRLNGDRLSTLISFEALKLAAGIVMLSPYIPLLFMGEEWGEPAPFQYFTSHSDADLVEAIGRGRREEFADFRWQGEPPDAQDEGTFLHSKLDHGLKCKEPHRTLLKFYRELIKLRKTLSALRELSKEHKEVRSFEKDKTLVIRCWSSVPSAPTIHHGLPQSEALRFRQPTEDLLPESAELRSAAAWGTGEQPGLNQGAGPHGRAPLRNNEVLMLANFTDESRTVRVDESAGEWRKVLDSADDLWRGPGSPVPPRFTSPGEARLSLAPKSLSVMERKD